MAEKQAHLSEEAVTALSSRLASEPLTLPRSAGDAPDTAKKREYLNHLLRWDPGVFLERHSAALSGEERAYFEPLRGHSFEVNFYMEQLEDADRSAKGVTVRNRRLAWLNRQDASGDYFSEEAMRKRAPALHELYMGGSAPVPDHPGGNDTFDRLEREAVLHEQRIDDLKQARQQQEVGEEEEEEEEEGAERPGPPPVHEAAARAAPAHGHDEEVVPESAAAAPAGREGSAQDFDMLLSVMKARFLSGHDGAYVDYKAVDADAGLDDDWAAVANQDAQERYFDAD